MHVTMKDVASKAHVAASTVSRVIANSPKISDATKKIVNEAMKELNYQPNIIARSLANRKTYTLGLILPTKSEEIFENPFFIRAMQGISSYAQKKGYYIMYSYCHSIEDELKTAETFIRSKWVDGIILMASRVEDPCVKYLVENDHPFVIIGRPEENYKNILWVDNDNIKAMKDVVSTMIQQGHKKIMFVGGEKQFTVNRHRLQGYQEALREAEIVYDHSYVLEDCSNEDELYKMMTKRLIHQKIDALVGTDDTLACAAYNAINDAGLTDVAVAGFNNTPMSLYKTPSVSSVDIRAELLGENAAKLLIQHLDNESEETKEVIVETRFIERETTLKKIRI